MPGEPFLWPALTGAETFEFLARLHGGTDVAYRDELVERFQLDTRKKIRALSKGNRQKVQLIAALATRADLLLLDEPTSGLDPLMEMAFRECVNEAKERGQTVFLSSHILSEVEALCDRVGILRAGKLVDEGTLAELRHLAAQTVEVTFAGPAPELPPLPGIHAASAGPNALRFEVSGSVGPLIAALAEHPVATLRSREPSLEEIFLHHYDGSDGRVAASGVASAPARPARPPILVSARARPGAAGVARRPGPHDRVRVPVRDLRLHPAGRLPRTHTRRSPTGSRSPTALPTTTRSASSTASPMTR